MGLHYDEQRLEGRDEFKDSGSNSRPLIILRNVCEICGHSFDNQFMFYKHLKEHYEPEFVQIGYPAEQVPPIPEDDEIESEYGKDDDNSGFVNDNEQFEEIFANNINKSPDMIEHLEIFIKNQESRAESYQTNDDRFGVIDGDGMMMIEDPGTVAEIEENVRAEAENIQRNGNGGVQQSSQDHVNEIPMELSQQANTSLYYQQQLKAAPTELIQQKPQPEEPPERHFAVIPPESPASPVESQQQPDCIPLLRPATPLDSPQSPTTAVGDVTVIVKTSPPAKTKSKTEKVTYPCHKCDRRFDTTTALKYHVTAHDPRTIQCGHCDKMFLTKSTLQVHMRIHLEERPYGCPQCELRFRQKNDLNYHVASKHTAMQDYQFKCEFCDKKFARKYSLNLHTKLHTGTKDHCCEICSKAFRASSYLQVHLRTHSGERPYECTECQKKFSVKADLRRHTKKMHKEKDDQEVEPSKEVKPAPSTLTLLIKKKQKVKCK